MFRTLDGRDDVDIYDHIDLRHYLDAWFRSRKASNPRYSHRAFALKLKSRDPSVLLNIIRGRRRLPFERIDAFVLVLGLDLQRAEYFRGLVRLAYAPDEAGRREARATLERLRGAARGASAGAPEALAHAS